MSTSQTCPECGGNMRFDSNHKRYVCQSCGLAVTKEEIYEIRAKYIPTSDEEERDKRRKEYEKWWSKKK